jgi:hypothetical protein
MPKTIALSWRPKCQRRLLSTEGRRAKAVSFRSAEDQSAKDDCCYLKAAVPKTIAVEKIAKDDRCRVRRTKQYHFVFATERHFRRSQIPFLTLLLKMNVASVENMFLFIETNVLVRVRSQRSRWELACDFIHAR